MRHILQPFYILCYDVFVNFHYRSRLLVLLRGYIISKVRRKHVEITLWKLLQLVFIAVNFGLLLFLTLALLVRVLI